MTDPTPASHVRVAVIGAGFAGLCMGIRLREHGTTDFVVLERADDIGGAWRDNTYPGCACDVPSNLYSFSFAPNPEWTRTFPSRSEIHHYLRACFSRYGLRPYTRFGHEVLSAKWHDEGSYWSVVTTGGALTANVLISATGPLSEPATPRLPGLERFTGVSFHSAAWDHSHDLSGRCVAVIGTGASATQFIPEIQPNVTALYIFQRTPPWVLPRWDRSKSVFEKYMYRRLPVLQRLARGAVYWGRESFIIGLAVNEWLLKPAEWLARLQLHRQIHDPLLRAALTPDYTLGCKRLVLSSTYFPTISQPNTELVTTPIHEVRPASIVTVDGRERNIDTIVHATGFEPANMPIARRLRGRNKLLSEEWSDGAQAYLGTAVAGFPNLFMLVGPNAVSGQNSSLLTMEAQVGYVIDALRFMEANAISAVEVKAQAQSSFVAGLQARMWGTVWITGCRSWYLDDRGRNTTLWPGFTGDFRRRTRRFDPEAYLLRRLAPAMLDWDGGTGRVSDTTGRPRMTTVNVRYIVDDVEKAVAFYNGYLGFTTELRPGPGFAIVARESLRLLLSAPGGGGGAGQSMPDGRIPEPGGWNRIQLEVEDLAAEVEVLRKAGARFRNDIVIGRGGKQILVEDPAGNPIELFESGQR